MDIESELQTIDGKENVLKKDASYLRVLNAAKGLNSFVFKFLMPFIEELRKQGCFAGVAALDDREIHSNKGRDVSFCNAYYDIKFGTERWQFLNPSAILSMIRIMKEGQYDIVHCHTAVTAAVTRIAAGIMGSSKPLIIYTTHGFHFYKGASLYRWLLFYPAERILARFTDIIITVNREDYLLARKFKRPIVCQCPGVGVNLNMFYPDEEIRYRFRLKESIDENTFIMLSVCELIPRKNVISVIRAVHVMKQKELLGSFQYWICGNGSQLQWLQKKVNKWGLDSVIRFWGHREDIADYYRAADLFILPSKQEGLPVALMEAMASGLPVIASDIRGCRDLIDSGKNGLLIRPETGQIISAIQKLRAMKQTRRSFSECGLEIIKQYDQEKVVCQVVNLYRGYPDRKKEDGQ